MSEFDSIIYLRPPRIDVKSGVALAIALINAAPKKPSAGIKRTARKLRNAAKAMQTAWAARTRKTPTQTKVKTDNRIDRGWRGLRARLEAYGNLPADAHPDAPRANELVETLFPEGLAFLTLPMESQWAHGQQILNRIKKDNLAPDIDKLAGPEFLAEVQNAQKDYGDVLGITRPEELPADDAVLIAPLRALSKAIGDYTLQVLASIDEEVEGSLETARRALLPLDRHREAAAKRSAGKPETEQEELPEIDPSTPIPELPEDSASNEVKEPKG